MTNTVIANTPTVLIADDYPDVLVALRLLLKGEGFQLETVSSPERLLDALGQRSFDLVLMDLNYTRDTTSGAEGLNLLDRIRLLDETLPIVAMTAWGTIELAVEAMQRGVCDFILKPWDNVRLLQTLRTHLEAGRARRRERQLQEQRQAEQVRELAAALEIQQSLLPHTILPLRGCELATAWHPVRAVSGDFFNVLHFDDSTSAICIGDVSGKGMPAALVMSNAQALTKAFAEAHCPPSELCALVNRALCGQLSPGKFVTFFYAHFDSNQRALSYSNAGHNPPLLLRKDGECFPLEQGGPVLGIFKDQMFDQAEIALASGDRLLLYTDGITEAENENGEEFGEERLLSLLRSHRQLSAQALQQTVMAAVTEFCGGNFQDDATLLVLAVE
ncbi:MAG TPA: SpoIIE family protein phosphatase [Blastocatellia bacterium]|nr:SpoIIE family protein phosphatase [Blastocatellia bacterium]